MKTGILLLNFGEPAEPTHEAVLPFLERIFMANAGLMGKASPEEVRARSRRLAEERTPGLVEEYVAIGGSPLQRQAEEQAAGLETELRRRGHDPVVVLGMQFTDPTIGAAVDQLRAEGVESVIALPVYPLPGPSTTDAALRELRGELRRRAWDVPVHEVTDWHTHPDYVRLRADAIRETALRAGVSFSDPETRLVFSAHGTPLVYLEEGSRYDACLRELCGSLAAAVGAPDYVVGYQNHANRPGVKWTQPDIDQAIAGIDARRVVVDPISFMHEQSETLAELDHELRAEAEGRGLEFHRVPIPYAAPAFVELLSDLVEPYLASVGAEA